RIFSGKPYYLIAKDGQESLVKLGDEGLTKIHNTTRTSNFISIEDEDAVIVGIRDVIKQANDIERTSKKSNN
ncbi:MAG: alpha/beta fold hydrolase, partial [Clostridium sp.]